MENHPIPQDITGFQFKLIGNMTIKQFVYLAVGSVIAWIIYSSPLFFLIKFPLALVFALGGASFAFLPIEGRPMDLMFIHFMKALFNPTQFVYDKTGGDLYQQASSLNIPHPSLASLHLPHKKDDESQKNEAEKSQSTEPQNPEEKQMIYYESLANSQQVVPTSDLNTAPQVTPSHFFDNQVVAQQVTEEKKR